jgi:photosystem II stability/assembly factor-like uncharacterized protein
MRMLLLVAISVVQAPIAFQWTPQNSSVTARLRGVSAVSERVAWAGGANGTILRTADGGTTWQVLTIPSTEKLDFRDIDAIDEQTAYALSIGPGEASRIYTTRDAGVTWTEQFVNRDPKAFFDAMAFWDAKRGVAFSDSVDGQFVILTTADGGRNWTRVPPASLPRALDNEGAFAASGTNVAVVAPNHVWIGTGAGAQSRVLRSSDGGRTWHIATTPLASGPSTGIFSIAFRDARHGVIAGGDFQKESEAVDNAAVTADGGVTWTLVKGLSGFRSVVAFVPKATGAVVAIGPSGGDYSSDNGRTWTPLAGAGFHAFSFAPSGGVGWGVGEKGSIGKLSRQKSAELQFRVRDAPTTITRN